jgi:hypothetical protein
MSKFDDYVQPEEETEMMIYHEWVTYMDLLNLELEEDSEEWAGRVNREVEEDWEVWVNSVGWAD